MAKSPYSWSTSTQKLKIKQELCIQVLRITKSKKNEAHTEHKPSRI